MRGVVEELGGEFSLRGNASFRDLRSKQTLRNWSQSTFDSYLKHVIWMLTESRIEKFHNNNSSLTHYIISTNFEIRV